MHALDFGVGGNFSRENAARFVSAIQDFTRSTTLCPYVARSAARMQFIT